MDGYWGSMVVVSWHMCSLCMYVRFEVFDGCSTRDLHKDIEVP